MTLFTAMVTAAMLAVAPSQRPDSARIDSLRRAAAMRSESIVSARRRMAAEAARNAPRDRHPLSGDNAPFYGYTWVFYADLAAGGLIAWLFAWWRNRDTGGLSAPWAAFWLAAGAALGAMCFLPVFMVSAILSVGFSETPPGLLFFVTLGAMGWLIGSIGELASRRRRRPF